MTDFNFNPQLKGYAIKQPVFSFSKFKNVNKALGPEMKSTGEVMGIDKSFLTAYTKSIIASGTILPKNGKVFLSIDDTK